MGEYDSLKKRINQLQEAAVIRAKQYYPANKIVKTIIGVYPDYSVRVIMHDPKGYEKCVVYTVNQLFYDGVRV